MSWLCEDGWIFVGLWVLVSFPGHAMKKGQVEALDVCCPQRWNSLRVLK